ncbi:MAG: hypothetical protein C0403_12245 [Desulfobacterium sp.]|nr:hypothetical protein [Desulfobacterium sp.]
MDFLIVMLIVAIAVVYCATTFFKKITAAEKGGCADECGCACQSCDLSKHDPPKMD